MERRLSTGAYTASRSILSDRNKAEWTTDTVNTTEVANSKPRRKRSSNTQSSGNLNRYARLICILRFLVVRGGSMAELGAFPRSSQRYHSKFVRRGYRSIERSFGSISPQKNKIKTLALARVVLALPTCSILCSCDDRASCKRFLPRPWTSVATDPCRERARIRERDRDTWKPSWR